MNKKEPIASCPDSYDLSSPFVTEIRRAGLPLNQTGNVRWSDYTFDECAYCGEHMGIWADTYEFNLHFANCPKCNELNMSGYINGKFVWRKVPKKQRSEEEILNAMMNHKMNCEQAFHSDCEEFQSLKRKLKEII